MTDIDYSDPASVARYFIRESDYSDQPGRFKVLQCTPGGSSLALGGQYELVLSDDGSGEWIATYADGGHTWTGRSQYAIGAFLAMIADRCGLTAEIS